ncbi:MAG: tyrosine-type recombinase/integrase [Eubacteriales bacterium]|nr:tyrosine-type recombinase/integrase [Eubacteriales bacterium]MDD4390451.1 tyrosine-type recombinase/integrase [Eubacteriales bacterium]
MPYCLRHTYCTDLQDAGVPINVAKELMGHSDISVTAKIYTHRTETSYNNAKDLINRHQSGAQKVTLDGAE